jgi:hypothetical protein
MKTCNEALIRIASSGGPARNIEHPGECNLQGRKRSNSGDPFCPGAGRQGVLGLQGMLSTLPYIICTGSLSSNRSARVSFGFFRTFVRKIGKTLRVPFFLPPLPPGQTQRETEPIKSILRPDPSRSRRSIGMLAAET